MYKIQLDFITIIFIHLVLNYENAKWIFLYVKLINPINKIRKAY